MLSKIAKNYFESADFPIFALRKVITNAQRATYDLIRPSHRKEQ